MPAPYATYPIPKAAKAKMPEYLELKERDWNNVVDNSSQCQTLTTEEEIKFLDKKNKKSPVVSCLNM